MFSAGQTMLQWNFALPVPFAAMKTTVAAFTTLQQNITQNNTGLTLSFSVQGTQVSQQLQQMQTCPLAGLLSDAQTEAQQLANAAGLMAGAVLALSSGTSSTASVCTITVKFFLGQ